MKLDRAVAEPDLQHGLIVLGWKCKVCSFLNADVKLCSLTDIDH